MAISRKISEMIEKSSWIRKMFETGSQLKEEYGAENVCDFSLGNPDLPPPDSFSRCLKEQVYRGGASREMSNLHGYMPNAGYPDVRTTIAGYLEKEHNLKVSGRNVLMTCGAGGALNVALKTIMNPGDMVMTSAPGFMEYFFYADNSGGSLDMIRSREDFDLDVEKMERRITEYTAALIINSPNNPSGKVYPESTLSALGQMLEKKSREIGRTIYLISDEPYTKIVYEGVKVPSVFNCYRNSILITSFSKDLSIPGERIGYMAVHPEADDVDEFLNGAVLCNRILGFVNAPALMQRTVGEILGETVDVSIYQRRRDLLCDALGEIGYTFQIPDGTFYLFPQAPGGDDVTTVAALQEERILTVPGRGFGVPGYFRIAFCVEEEVILRSFDGFRRAFENLS